MAAIDSVPNEIKGISQWTFTKQAENKAPKHTTFEPEGGKSFDELKQALKNGKGLLKAIFYATMEDPYILCDYDHLEDCENPFPELPPDLGYMLKTNPTYTEVSRGGDGIRFVYKLESADLKNQLAGHVFKGLEVSLDRKPEWSHICIHKPGMTFTGKKLDYSTDSVTTITLDQLKKVYNLKFKKDFIRSVNAPTKSGNLPSPADMIKLLHSLPIDANPRIQRAYLKTFKNEKHYDHYNYWTKVMAALKEYTMHLKYDTEILQAFIDWSSKDHKHYEGVETVQKHWVSFQRSDGEIITFRTLISLHKNYNIKWKVPRAQTEAAKKAGAPKKPMLQEYVNFKQLLDHYNIKIYGNDIEHHVYYLTGDCDALDENFHTSKVQKHFNKYYGPYNEEVLERLFTIFLQANQFTGISNNTVRNHLINHITKISPSINLFKIYLDTPFDKLSKDYQDNAEYYETSTLDSIWKCITIDPVLPKALRAKEKELYKTFLRKWLMGILRGQYYKGRFGYNNCILILSGQESGNKSSFFDLLLPEFFSRYITSPGHGFSSNTDLRDLSKLACEHLILTWDDIIYSHINSADETTFKKAIENRDNSFVDKWAKDKTTVTPFAIYGATSNKREFKMSDDGNRRLFIIPVKDVDTVKLLKICWHPILNQLKKEMFDGITESTSPWLLTEEEIQFQLMIHRKFKSGSNLDVILRNVYDTEAKFKVTSLGNIRGCTDFKRDKSGTLQTTTMVKVKLASMFPENQNLFGNFAQLERALTRLCSDYTNTARNTLHCTTPKCYIKHGRAYANDKKKWVMPPLLTDSFDFDDEGDEITEDDSDLT